MEKLYTDRLIIMPLKYEMIDIILDKRSAFEDRYNLKLSKEWPMEAIKGLLPKYINVVRHNPEEAQWGVWIMIDKKSNYIIGDLGFKGSPDNNGIIEVGYSIVESYRNRGLTSEGVGELIKWAFLKQEVNKITARCLVDNYPSIKVLERLKFKKVVHKADIIYWEKNRL
ncbi:GNAT family N-acetyltransferase [Clostridium sp. D2Q-11]|uniref:GNAT family N-acetyltransferase n=1 Tax=Anaeromonas frigoriresistens TaxID=2683708 RepID=A0A942Z937_9FIRM|nr:GNAT family protein [Anaeromonas frigoriresistens]MBS4538689.1 GNAT family N-acetyltransferase [Anaeromonas frigoriresistens]